MKNNPNKIYKPEINKNISPVGAPLVGAHNQTVGAHATGNHKGLPLPQRKSIRLRGYDYSQAGFYFVTICTQNRLHLFGEIMDDDMVLNDAGEMVNKIWYEIPNNFNHIQLHEFTIMPNHIHSIIEIVPVGAPLVAARNQTVGTKNSGQPQGVDNGQPQGIDNGQPQGIAPTVGDIVGAFKSLTTNEYIKMVKQDILPPFNKHIWQRNYWEHIVRNENEYIRIAQYVLDNPKKWALDKLNVGASPCGCPNQVMEPPAMYGQNIFCLNDEAWMV